MDNKASRVICWPRPDYG